VWSEVICGNLMTTGDVSSRKFRGRRPKSYVWVTGEGCLRCEFLSIDIIMKTRMGAEEFRRTIDIADAM